MEVFVCGKRGRERLGWPKTSSIAQFCIPKHGIGHSDNVLSREWISATLHWIVVDQEAVEHLDGKKPCRMPSFTPLGVK